jgi:hypothetical protein
VVDWVGFLRVLQEDPAEAHELNPPCDEDEIGQIELEFGELPAATREMLRHFNGGELFIDAIPLVTLCGVSTPNVVLPSALDLGSQTSTWRRTSGRHADWVIGFTNYGGLLVAVGPGSIREWDSAQQRWEAETITYDQLFERILAEGADYLGSE